VADPRLHLLQLASPALPVGAYAYSQGLEYAIEAGWVDDGSLQRWLEDLLQLGLATLDLPLLLRAYAACERGDVDALNAWNDLLLASRETHELLLEDQQLGTALRRLLDALLTPPPPTLQQAPGYAVMFALACQRWAIAAEDALLAYAYSWLENQVAAATKLVPLGQTRAQQLLVATMAAVPAACDAARHCDDDSLGLTLPRLAQASCAHERQYTRLFRS
jgi:urease accessory protein